ncbi:MAG TPA: TolC family protein [Polyangia bacterium]|jgi:cobalt-zinc-cadmium efflux system outer membrane protein|nr:TolC family protein [Polyangia bacterium]
MKRLTSTLALAGWLAAAPAFAQNAAPAPAASGALTQDEAVSIALQRNRDVIAARLEIDAAELDVVAARVYPNPTLSYALGNLVLGKANPQTDPATGVGIGNPGFFGQPVQSVGISQVIDVWSKRGARTHVAEEGVARRRLLTEDALREIVYAVRSAFADVSREQNERDLAREVADRYAQTVRISQSRFRAGDISEADLRKIELEGTRYQNAVVDAETEWDLARGRLATLMGVPSARELPERVHDPDVRAAFDRGQLVADALAHRPDLQAAGAARKLAEAEISAARREVYPDVEVGASYTHSSFTVSGDNPNTMGLTLSVPLPLFDRNKAGIGRARLDVRRAENERERLRLLVEHDVTEAVRKAARAQELLRVFEGESAGASTPVTPVPAPLAITATHDVGGMLKRAEIALSVAERSYKAGAASLLDLLEAQRTFLDTRAQYLRVLYDYRQAAIDVTHAVGEGTP